MSPASVLDLVRLWSREEVLARRSPVPKSAGVYAWYFKSVPGAIDVSGCAVRDDMSLLYVGIAPKRPYKDGRRSRATLHQRVRYHYRSYTQMLWMGLKTKTAYLPG